MAASKVRRVRSEAFRRNITICLASRAWRKSSGDALTAWASSKMAAIFRDGEIGDRGEVAAGERLGGFGEGGVGLDAERGFGEAVAAIRAWVHHDGFVIHGCSGRFGHTQGGCGAPGEKRVSPLRGGAAPVEMTMFGLNLGLYLSLNFSGLNEEERTI